MIAKMVMLGIGWGMLMGYFMFIWRKRKQQERNYHG